MACGCSNKQMPYGQMNMGYPQMGILPQGMPAHTGVGYHGMPTPLMGTAFHGMPTPHMAAYQGMPSPHMGTTYTPQMGPGYHVPQMGALYPGVGSPQMGPGLMPQTPTHQMQYMQQQSVVAQQPTIRDEEYVQDYEW